VRRAAGLASAVLCAALATGRAQEPADSARPATHPHLSLSVTRDDRGAIRPPVVRLQAPLSDGMFAAALRDGFPVRFHFALELRRSVRILPDRLDRSADWEAVVVLDPLTNEFDLVRSGGSIEHFTTQNGVAAALATPFTVDLLPRDSGQFYYVAMLEIESLSLSELDEVERWLRGDVGPAISQRGDVGEAVGHGIRRFLIRLSGLPRRRLEIRSAFFRP